MVVVAESPILEAIGAKSSSVRLSRDTAITQVHRHPDLEPGDYATVQRLVDEGELFTVGKHHAIGFLQVDGKMWSADVKATGDGSRNYLASFHRAQPHDLEKANFRLDRVQR